MSLRRWNRVSANYTCTMLCDGYNNLFPVAPALSTLNVRFRYPLILDFNGNQGLIGSLKKNCHKVARYPILFPAFLPSLPLHFPVSRFQMHYRSRFRRIPHNPCNGILSSLLDFRITPLHLIGDRIINYERSDCNSATDA